MKCYRYLNLRKNCGLRFFLCLFACSYLYLFLCLFCGKLNTFNSNISFQPEPRLQQVQMPSFQGEQNGVLLKIPSIWKFSQWALLKL